MRQAAQGFILGTLFWFAVVELGLMEFLAGDPRLLWLPVGAAFAALAATRLRVVLWGAAGLVGLLVLLVAFTPLIAEPARRLVRADRIQPSDAVVVLSSRVNAEGNLDEDALYRLLDGLTLIDQGRAATLIRTRIGPPSPPADADVARILALRAREPIVEIVGPVFSTRDEAVAVAALARKRGWTRILLVTSPLHSRRAAAAFEKVGLTVISVPCTDRGYALSSLTRPEERLRVFPLWLREAVGWPVYQARGWL